MAYILNEPGAEAVLRTIMTGQGQVPDLLRIEGANALVNAMRHGRLAGTQISARYALIEKLPVQWHSSDRLIARAIDISVAWNRRPYDGVFIALAEALDTVVLTLDGKLVRGLEGTPLAHRVRMHN